MWWIFGKKRRRRRLQSLPFPDRWGQILRRNVHLFSRMTSDDQAALCRITRILIAEKRWDGCNGQVIDDEVKLTIAGQAAVLLLGIEHDFYRRLKTILVYPAGYLVPQRRPGGFGSGNVIVHEQVTPVLGQAHVRGPVVLSWQDALHGGRREADGRNVVFHEFAHKLDMLDDLSDGTPPLRDQAQFERWVEVMQREYERLVHRAETGRATLIDTYGATNPAEFFAVCTEAFYEQPIALRRRHRDLYEAMRGYFNRDPARWFE